LYPYPFSNATYIVVIANKKFDIIESKELLWHV